MWLLLLMNQLILCLTVRLMRYNLLSRFLSFLTERVRSMGSNMIALSDPEFGRFGASEVAMKPVFEKMDVQVEHRRAK